MRHLNLDRAARILAVASFVLICWVAHRTLEQRGTCVNSPFIAYVRFEAGARVENCRFESRLDLRAGAAGRESMQQVRALEILENTALLWPGFQPRITVEISASDPHAFALAPGGLRLGAAWLRDVNQLRHALMMAVLKERYPVDVSHFDLEVMADFLNLALHGEDGVMNVLARDVKFPTAAVSFSQYCQSPLRSLAHAKGCEANSEAAGDIWGFRPLFAAGLWRVYKKLPLRTQLAVLQRARDGSGLPRPSPSPAIAAENYADWFEKTFMAYVAALGMEQGEEGQWAVKRALKELEVEAPTRWELTVDLTRTPAWKEIVEQLKARSRYRSRERALVFTPEGEVALPSGLPVGWNAADVQSQKHVLIACHWPAPGDAVPVRAREFFARQSCGKLSQVFWD